ncbi:N-acetylneuraminate synthase [Salinibaculum marinum]
MHNSEPSLHIERNSLDADSVYFIAEAGVNHNGDLDQARELIDVARGSGADAVKFQTFTANRFVSKGAKTADYQKASTNVDSQYELLQEHELSKDEFQLLQEYAENRGITFLSTPFDRISANIVNEMGVPAIKLGSGELTNHPLLRHVAEFGKPMIVSTGMGTMGEVADAVTAIRETNSNVDLALLHCTSMYPAASSTVNLRAMNRMAEKFDVPVGYSDHTTQLTTPGYATAAGALIVEKHFTLDQSLPGPDHHASLEPAELDRAVSLAREAAIVRGSPEKRPTPGEEEMKRVTRKSLHAARDLATDTTLSPDDITIKRPADGISPGELQTAIGRSLATAVNRDEPITEEDLQ